MSDEQTVEVETVLTYAVQDFCGCKNGADCGTTEKGKGRGDPLTEYQKKKSNREKGKVSERVRKMELMMGTGIGGRPEPRCLGSV